MGLDNPPADACPLTVTALFPRPSRWMTPPSGFSAIGLWTRSLPTWTSSRRNRSTVPMPVEVRRTTGEDENSRPQGLAPEDVIEDFLPLVLPYGRGQNHPCFAAFVDPAASKLSMLAAFASAVTNTSGAGGNYAAIYVERAVIRWLVEIVGFPADRSDGVLLGGGSDANRHCLEVARYWGAVNGWDIARRASTAAQARLSYADGLGCLLMNSIALDSILSSYMNPSSSRRLATTLDRQTIGWKLP